ncbi:MAG: hypothetical protein Q7S06_01110 [Nanoarchaeota archaeon]|nr:hypothetical protein [Nanoarchaeota archaeon]
MTRKKLSSWFKGMGLATALYMGTLFRHPNPEEPKAEKPRPFMADTDKDETYTRKTQESQYQSSAGTSKSKCDSCPLKNNCTLKLYSNCTIKGTPFADKERRMSREELLLLMAMMGRGYSAYNSSNSGQRQYTQESYWNQSAEFERGYGEQSQTMRHLNPSSVEAQTAIEQAAIRGRRIIDEFFESPMEQMIREFRK